MYEIMKRIRSVGIVEVEDSNKSEYSWTEGKRYCG